MPGSVAATESGGPGTGSKRKAGTSSPRETKHRRVTPETDVTFPEPQYEEPPPRIRSDGTSSVPPPAEAMKIGWNAPPLLLQPPEFITYEGNFEQIVNAQQHAFRVLNGLCWQEEPDLPVLEDSVFTYGDCEMPPEAKWTSSQKYQFIELVGRRSAANLESIAKLMGKSLLDCELYLEALRCGAEELQQELAISWNDIPEAAETREAEPTVFEPEDHVIGGIDDKGECLLALDELEERMSLSFSREGIVSLIDAVSGKIRAWVQGADSFGPYNQPRAEPLEEFFDSQTGKQLGYWCPEKEKKLLDLPPPGTGPLPYDSEVGEEAINTSSSEDGEP